MLDASERRIIGHGQRLVLFLATLVVALVSVSHVVPFTVNGIQPSLFSQDRAMQHIVVIASRPHPVGSSANATVRAYLVDQIRRLGFSPEVQTAVLVDPDRNLAGKIQNVLVKVPGSSPGKALLLMAHYDSVHTGPGAADDGASVAAMLEMLRLMRNQGQYRNDVIFLFTDGEEAGLLGAQGFVEQHPWAREVGLVLNFEYRGNSGAFMMFETSGGNGKLITGLAQAAPTILANSLMGEVYKFLPNDTDMSVFKNAGVPAMNFAAIRGLSHYHTALDRPELLDRDTLQQEGDLMSALLEHFGNRQLDNLVGDDAVYFDLPGIGLIQYPARWALPSALGTGFLAVCLVGWLRQKRQIRIRRVAIGGLFFLAGALGLAVLSQLLWYLLRILHPDYRSFAFGDPYNSRWYLMAFSLLSCLLILQWRRMAERWLNASEMLYGALLCWWGLLVWVAFRIPGASFLLQWPLSALLLALAFKQLVNNTPYLLAVALFFGITPGIFLFAPLLIGLFDGLGMSQIGIVVLVWVWFLGLLTPWLELVGHHRFLNAAFWVSGLFCLVAASAMAGFDNRHPRQNSLSYRMNVDSGQAWWLSGDERLDAFTSGYFPDEKAKRKYSDILGERFPPVWLSPAPMMNAARPDVEVVENVFNETTRKLVLRIRSKQAASVMRILLDAGTVLSAKIEGHRYLAPPGKGWMLRCIGWSDEPILVAFELLNERKIVVQLSEIIEKLPEFALSRPADMIEKPLPLTGRLNGGTTIVYHLLITNYSEGNLM